MLTPTFFIFAFGEKSLHICKNKDAIMKDIKDTFLFQSVPVAEFLVAKAFDRKISMNVTKVQKLMFIVYGTFLRVYGKRLTDEHPQAWPYGPVFPRTRERFLSPTFDLPLESIPEDLKSDTGLSKVIDFTLNNFGSLTSGQLTEWSHKKGTPWEKATQQRTFRWGDIICDNDIYDFFERLITVTKDGGNN